MPRTRTPGGYVFLGLFECLSQLLKSNEEIFMKSFMRVGPVQNK